MIRAIGTDVQGFKDDDRSESEEDPSERRN